MEHMDLKELKETDIWTLYEQSKNYCTMTNMFSETDKNYRFYNGDQWHGAKLGGIEPVQQNFIKPIVKYKVGVLHGNNYAINFSSDNYNNEFRQTAEKICEMLNKKAAKVWEKNSLDIKARVITKDSAINAEGLMYATYDSNTEEIISEILKKNNVFYGNENDSDIQNQPYILIKKRMPLINVIENARKEGLSEDKIELIIPDNNTEYESGDSAKNEKDQMVTVITKMWKEEGTVWFEKSTRLIDIKKKTNTGLKLYPIAHLLWEEKEGSARGEGEVKFLIPTQIEVNKNLVRSIVVTRNTAYPQRVARIDKIQNPSALDSVGGIIKVQGQDVDDVNKVFNVIHPAQMSTDVEKLRNELIQVTRDLAGAGDIATGTVNPEDASGKAILAVQNASKEPMTEQLIALKTCIEDIARIWLDMWITYSQNGLKLESSETDENGEEYINVETISQTTLEELRANVKVDITPKSAFDKYAQEISIENLLKEGYFNAQRLGELKVYAQILDDDSTMPKVKLEEAIKYMEEEQMRIAQINSQVQMMQQRADAFLGNDPESQASTIADIDSANQTENQATE